jgi:transposase
MSHSPRSHAGGRPSKLTPEIVQKVREILPVALYIETVAAYLGVDRQTFYNWIKRGEREAKRLQKQKKPAPRAKEALYLEFFHAVKKALAEGEFHNALLIRTAATDGESWTAAAWLLERRFPERWGQRQRLEHSGPRNKPIPIEMTVEHVLTAHKELESWEHERFTTTPNGTRQDGSTGAPASGAGAEPAPGP